MKKEAKRLNKDLVLAIDWAAAEYKYLGELQDELQEIEKSDKPLKRLRKASKILHYVSRAERRTDKFEERARKKIEDVYEELEEHLGEQLDLKELIDGIREIAKELQIEHAHLVKYSSFYEGTLEKELDKAAAEEKLEEKIKESDPKKAREIHAAFLQLIGQMEYQIRDAEKWISALETSLKKAKDVLSKLPDEDKIHLRAEGLRILHKYGWLFPDDDKTTIVLAQHPADLKEMAVAAGKNAGDLFRYGLPAVKYLINEKTWPGMVQMVIASGKNAGDLFRSGLPAVRNLINEKTWSGMVKMAVAAGENAGYFFYWSLPAVKYLINEKTWPGMVKMAVAAGKNAGDLFRYGLPAVKYLINEKTWPGMVQMVETLGETSGVFFQDVLSFQFPTTPKRWIEALQFVEKNKNVLRQALYVGQQFSFFRDADGKMGIIRGKLRKTGSETIVLGGPLIGKVIIRIITDEAFQSWKKAFEAEKVWRSLGFDYVPIEPILRKDDKLRAFKTKKRSWRVSTKVLGPALRKFENDPKNKQYLPQLQLMKTKIKEGLDILKIRHGHLHEDNFCIGFHDRKLRLYAIDFDQAVS